MYDISVLIGDNTSAYGSYCADLLMRRGIPSFSVARNGYAVLEKVRGLRPDIVFVDTAVAMLEIHDLLVRLDCEEPKPIIIVTTGHDSPDMQRGVMARGASFYLPNPQTVTQICDYIEKVVGFAIDSRPKPIEKKPIDVTEEVANVFRRLNIPRFVKGYKYLIHAISYGVEHSSSLTAMTNDLYPYVANLFDTKAVSVDRAVRTAIRLLWQQSNKKMMEYYLPFFEFDLTQKPKNAMFIAAFADKIRLRLGIDVEHFEPAEPDNMKSGRHFVKRSAEATDKPPDKATIRITFPDERKASANALKIPTEYRELNPLVRADASGVSKPRPKRNATPNILFGADNKP